MRSPSFLLAGLLLTSTSPIPVDSDGFCSLSSSI
jgi:hypothetical protein